VLSRNICFGHLLIAVRRGRQRRDEVAAEEDQLSRRAAGQSKYYRLSLYGGYLNFSAILLRRAQVAGLRFAAAPKHASTVATSLASAAQNLATFFLRDFGDFVYFTEVQIAGRLRTCSHAGTQSHEYSV
jgi:hypothetical protein